MHEALPLEGEREHGTMPQQSPCEGVLAILKGTTPGDLEWDLPWDPGRENVESKRACKASEDDVAGFDARNRPLTWPPKELVGWHHRNKATTHLYPYPILPSHRREVDSSRLEAHREGQRRSWEIRKTDNKAPIWWSSHTSCAASVQPPFLYLYLYSPRLCSRSTISSTMSTSTHCRRPSFTSNGNCNPSPR